MQKKRKVVVFIGSTRFQDTFLEEAWKYTKEGWVVLLPNFRPSTMMSKGFDIPVDVLEDIGYNKINVADLVYVVNESGYVGESTSKEIEYAKSIHKPIKYMEEAAESK